MNKGINVLSLFDGMSCGRVALERAEIKVNNYYSSEIDKYAIQIANKNYPQDEVTRLGDVLKVSGKSLPQIDLLIGGSPCQGFSMMGKLKGSSTKGGIDVTSLEQYIELKEQNFEFEGQSYLFWEYVRILKETKPKYFLLENVRVTKKWLPMFNEAMGCEGVLINSNLLSAQDRPRYYWTNIPYEMPKDKNISIVDILEDIEISKPLSPYMTREFDGVSRLDKGIFNYTKRTKGVTQTTGASHGCKYIIKGSPKNPIAVRKLTPIEQERLQTLSDNYTYGVSNTERGRMIGNGWTVDVIAHILSYAKF